MHLKYFLDALLEVKDFSKITESVKGSRASIGEDYVMDVQWCTQPYELLGFPSTMDTAILAMEAEDQFRRIMDKILKLDEKLMGLFDEFALGCRFKA